MENERREGDGIRRRTGREGFTLIELLIVVVIIAILAAIAIPQFDATKGQAYRATMKSDLRNLSSAQEHYFAGNDAYASSVSDLQTDADFQTSEGVSVTMQSGTSGGWSATADHGGVPGSGDCGIYYGSASSPASQLSGNVGSTSLGVPFCVD